MNEILGNVEVGCVGYFAIETEVFCVYACDPLPKRLQCT